jgi:hypothetical protein
MWPRAKKWLVVADWTLWELAIREGFPSFEAEAARPEARPGAALWTRLRAIGWRLRDDR